MSIIFFEEKYLKFSKVDIISANRKVFQEILKNKKRKFIKKDFVKIIENLKKQNSYNLNHINFLEKIYLNNMNI